MPETLSGRLTGGDTRERMIDAAVEIMAERGHDGMSLQMVADATGLTKAAVYYHFNSKGQLVDAILQSLFSKAPNPPEPADLRSRRTRLTWAAEQILDALTRERRVIAVISGDPVIRKQPRFISLVEATRQHVLQTVYGDEPTAEERAAFYVATSAVHAVPDLAELTDAELVLALRPVIYRTLGLPRPQQKTPDGDAAEA